MASEGEHLLYQLVYIQLPLFGRRFPYECSDSSNDGTCASTIRNDFFQSLTQDLRFQLVIGEESQACVAVIGYGGQRWINFIGYRRSQFSQGGQPGDAGKLRSSYLQGMFCLFASCNIFDNAKPKWRNTICTRDQGNVGSSPNQGAIFATITLVDFKVLPLAFD